MYRYVFRCFLRETREGDHETHEEELWADKEITTTLTAPGTIRTAVGRKMWSKILGKTSLKKLVSNCGCFKNCSTGSQFNFLSTGVILVYLLVFDTILAALFWMRCNFCRLNLE